MIIRSWRKKGTKAEWHKLSNRKLILMLGQQFESEGIWDSIREKDPKFVEFYESLKLMHDLDP